MGFCFLSLDSLSIRIYLSTDIEECVCGGKRGFMRFRSSKRCTLVRLKSSACDMHHYVK